jgi:hypothetical protein
VETLEESVVGEQERNGLDSSIDCHGRAGNGKEGGRGQGREAFRRFTAATAAQRTPQLTATTVPHQPEVENGKKKTFLQFKFLKRTIQLNKLSSPRKYSNSRQPNLFAVYYDSSSTTLDPSHFIHKAQQ